MAMTTALVAFATRNGSTQQVAEDIADCIAWCVTRPHHVNIDRLVVRPLAQAAQHKLYRVTDPEASRPVAAADQGRS